MQITMQQAGRGPANIAAIRSRNGIATLIRSRSFFLSRSFTRSSNSFRYDNNEGGWIFRIFSSKSELRIKIGSSSSKGRRILLSLKTCSSHRFVPSQSAILESTDRFIAYKPSSLFHLSANPLQREISPFPPFSSPFLSFSRVHDLAREKFG